MWLKVRALRDCGLTYGHIRPSVIIGGVHHMSGQKALTVCYLLIHDALLSGCHKLGDAEANESDAYESHSKVDQERGHPAIDKQVHKDEKGHGCHCANTGKTGKEKTSGK